MLIQQVLLLLFFCELNFIFNYLVKTSVFIRLGNVLFIDKNDFVYSVSEDGSSLQKYKVVFGN